MDIKALEELADGVISDLGRIGGPDGPAADHAGQVAVMADEAALIRSELAGLPAAQKDLALAEGMFKGIAAIAWRLEHPDDRPEPTPRGSGFARRPDGTFIWDFSVISRMEVLCEVAADLHAEIFRHMRSIGVNGVTDDKANPLSAMQLEAFFIRQWTVYSCGTQTDLAVVEGMLKGIRRVLKRLEAADGNTSGN